MRAIRITRPGGPEVLELQEVPAPVAGPTEVLVHVQATALNRADLLQRLGRYPAPPGAPADIPGLEFAGEVAHCGDRVRTLQPGDRVMGILGGGGHAEQVAIPEALCIRIPPGMDWEHAAAVPEAFLTSYDALFIRGQLTVGECLLVHAAGSGVGTAAVQLGHAAGARVIALSRSADKRARLSELGADAVFDPSADRLDGSIRMAGQGDGVDVALDLVGAGAWPLHARVLRKKGRLVVIGLLGGSRCEIDFGLMMRRQWTLTGSVLRSRPQHEKVRLVRAFSERVLPLLAAGRIRPRIHAVLPLERVADAHAMMERNENFGKIVLRVDGDGRA